jgi:Ssl1-like
MLLRILWHKGAVVGLWFHVPDSVSLICAKSRLLAPTAAIRRTIIRHLIILVDLSSSMMDRDMRPTRFDLTLEYAREFVSEWFDQNPLGQIGLVGMRGGVGERIGEMAGMFERQSPWDQHLIDR